MVACESVAFLFSLAAALLADSLTLWTNCLRIGLDLPASFFALYVTHRILRGQKGNFDYGLGKWENLSALINVPMMLVGLSILAFRSVLEFQNPRPITGTGLGFLVLVVFGAINLLLWRRFHRLNQAAPTPVIHSQLVLYRNASAASLLSLFALSGVWIAGPHRAAAYFDLFGAAILSALIIHGMTIIVRQSLSALLDEAVEESIQSRIAGVLGKFDDDYVHLHNLRSRHSGNRVFIEVFLEFDPVIYSGELVKRSARIKGQVEKVISNAEVWVIPTDSKNS
jgi:cation diffusion facilitator family transporter